MRFVKLVLIIATAIAALAVASQQQKKSVKSGATAAGSSSDRAEAVRLNNLGAALNSTHDYNAAAAVLRYASAVDTGYAAPFNNLGVALANLGRLDEAERVLRTAVRLAPAIGGDAYFGLGRVMQCRGNTAGGR